MDKLAKFVWGEAWEEVKTVAADLGRGKIAESIMSGKVFKRYDGLAPAEGVLYQN